MCNYGPYIPWHFASNKKLDIGVLVGSKLVKISAVQLKKGKKKESKKQRPSAQA